MNRVETVARHASNLIINFAYIGCLLLLPVFLSNMLTLPDSWTRRFSPTTVHRPKKVFQNVHGVMTIALR